MAQLSEASYIYNKSNLNKQQRIEKIMMDFLRKAIKFILRQTETFSFSVSHETMDQDR